MGRRGPAPLPTAIKAARGTLQKCRTNHEEPQLAPPKVTDPPAGLRGRGLVEWKRLVEPLIDAGVLRDADMVTFELYCRTLSDLEGYERLTSRNRELALAKGYAGMVVKLRNQAKQLAAELGLTPSSRSGVKAVEKKQPGTVERFLRRVK